MSQNPYLVALELLKINHGTLGQGALAKCVLSLYNSDHSFGIGEVLARTDDRYTQVVMNMLKEYSVNGETEELRMAGEYVSENFPRLIELSSAMQNARDEVRQEWEHQRQEEADRLYQKMADLDY